KRLFQFERTVEVVLDGRLAAAVDEDDLRRARGHRFLDDELDGGDVDDGQQLLGHGLGGGQEARAQAGGGDDDLAELPDHPTTSSGAGAKTSTAQASPPTKRPAGRLPRIKAGVRNSLAACAVV